MEALCVESNSDLRLPLLLELEGLDRNEPQVNGVSATIIGVPWKVCRVREGWLTRDSDRGNILTELAELSR